MKPLPPIAAARAALLIAAARAALVAAAFVAGCAPSDEGARYLGDARFRRDTLVASLVNPQNGYSQLRLAHYGNDWEALPEWNPAVATVDVDGHRRDDEAAFELSSTSPAALRTLGEAAFFRYPVQLAPQLAEVFASGAAAARGLWYEPTRGGGVVSTRLADGGAALALSCASCHARIADDTLVPGLPNQQLDMGWGPGRIDVSRSASEEPIEIPDLRVVALESNWQRDGSVRNDGLATLAIRVETLIITSHAGVVRPPRAIALALATYLQSLAPPAAPPPAGADAVRGAALFAARCAGCHAPPAFAGPIVPLEVVGTDPRVGLSAERGTGGYRVPSLRGVATRGRLLHDGTVADLAALFDPARSIAGHRFGLDLDADDRAALLAYLATL